MVKVLPIIGAVFSVSSLILFAVGIATNHWVVFQKSHTKLNPVLVNSKLEVGAGIIERGVTDSTRHIQYALAYYGLWIGCFREHKSAISCSFVGTGCSANICWTRKTIKESTRTCQDSHLFPLTSCFAFQLVRLLFLVATLMMIIGVSTQLVSIFNSNRTLAMLAGIIIFLSGIIIMTAFAVLYSTDVAQNGVKNIARIGWSFILVIVSWPLALIAGVCSCLMASVGLKYKEVSDYSASVQ